MALIAHWPLDGRLDDVSGNGYQLTNMGCEVFNDPEKGLCYKKNIIANGIISDEIKYLHPKNDFSVTCWFKDEDMCSWDNPISIGSTGPESSSKNIRVEKDDSNSITLHPFLTPLTKAPFPSGRWVFTVIVKSGNNVKLFLDGVLTYDFTKDNLNNMVDISGNKFIVNILKRDKLTNGSASSTCLIKDVRLFDSILTINDINKIMKEPYIDLDFKGSIPPTVNWLDSESKGLLRLDTDSGGTISREGLNKFKIIKRDNLWLPGPEFKPNFSKFVLSYKIRVLEGVLHTIGGHIDIIVTESVKCKWFVNGTEVKDFVYSHGGNRLPRSYMPGDIVSVSFVYDGIVPPPWSTRGIGIQLNRGLTQNVVGEIYDIQIEEGLIATPFCTWSRDYMQIPDKSSYRDSIKSVNQAGFGLPSYKLENNKPLGSKGVLTFDYNNALKLDNIPPLPKFSTSMVFTPTEFISTDVNNGQMCPIFSIAKFKSSNTDPKRFSVIYNTTLKKLTILYDNNSADCVIDRIININETVFIVVTLSSEGIIIYINGTKFSTNITNPVGVTSYDLILGKRNPSTVSSYKFELSDFKIYPYVFTDDEVANEYKKLKNRVKSMSSTFANIPTLNVEVPRLWENNPNTIGIDCFSNNPNIPESQAIPIGWGGAFKQPDTSILSVGTTTDMLVINPEEVIYIDPFLDSVPLHTLLIEDTQTNTESTLTLIKKSKF